MPVMPLHRQQLDAILKRFWNYCYQLLEYKKQSTPCESARVEADFDSLFATHTGYDELDKRIARVKGKRVSLLLVLKHPELPLNNYPAELGVRQRIRKRDISFGTRTMDGRKAWDPFMTLAETAKKFGCQFLRLPALSDHRNPCHFTIGRTGLQGCHRTQFRSVLGS